MKNGGVIEKPFHSKLLLCSVVAPLHQQKSDWHFLQIGYWVFPYTSKVKSTWSECWHHAIAVNNTFGQWANSSLTFRGWTLKYLPQYFVLWQLVECHRLTPIANHLNKFKQNTIYLTLFITFSNAYMYNVASVKYITIFINHLCLWYIHLYRGVCWLYLFIYSLY